MKKVFLLFALFFTLAVNAQLIKGGSADKKEKKEKPAGNVKTDYRNALVLAYSQANSVYEDDNIKLEIYDEQLWATNKTKKTIFIDLSQCFAFHNGASKPLFDSSKNKQGDKKASKKGVSTKEDEFISLAPAIGEKQSETWICNMTTWLLGKYTTSETPSNDFTEYDKRLIMVLKELLDESKSADPDGKEYTGTAVRHLTEDESINNIGASIAYAFNKKSEDWTTVSLTTWVSDVIFSPYYVDLPAELTKKEKKGFDVKETAPAVVHVRADTPFEFNEDRSPIAVLDWEGNYKKGTFELGSTRIAKSKGPSAWKIIGAVFTFGATLVGSYSETTYKSIIQFDGANSYWGKLTYVGNIMKTEQTK